MNRRIGKYLLALLIVSCLLSGCTNKVDKENDPILFEVEGEIVSKFKLEESCYITLAPTNRDHMSPITIYIEPQGVFDALTEGEFYRFVISVDINQEANRLEIGYTTYRKID